MQVQYIEKLPEESGLVAAIRQGNKLVLNASAPCAIAAPNLAELIKLEQVPDSFLRAVNDPKYGGSGPPPIDLDMLRYQAWLGSRSTFPDGLVCWRSDPNPGPYGPRWTDWSGASAEYRRRTRASEKQLGHEKPKVLPRTVSCRNVESYLLEAYEELAKIWIAQDQVRRKHAGITTQGSGVPDPAHQQVEHGNTELVGPPAPEQAVPKAQTIDWKALRIRDRMRTDNTRLTFSFIGEKRARYIYLCDKYSIHRAQAYRFTGNGKMKVAVRMKNRTRHSYLAMKLMDYFNRERIQSQAEMHAEEKGWDQYHVLGLLGDDTPNTAKEVQPPFDAEESAVKEPVMRPTEERTLIVESIEDTSHHEGTPYGLCLEAMAEGRKSPRLWNIWVNVAHMHRSKCHAPILRGRNALTSLYINTLKVGTMGDGDKDVTVKDEGPTSCSNDEPKYNGQPKYNEHVAPALSRPSTLDMRKKQQETLEYVKSVGGVSAFAANESGILLPPQVQ